MLPQGKSHYLILCQDPGTSLTSELFTPPPSGLWKVPAPPSPPPPPPWKSYPSQRYFLLPCLSEKYHSPRLEGIQVLGMTRCPCRELKSALSLQVRVVESLWMEQRGREKAEPSDSPMVDQKVTSDPDSFHCLVLVSCCWTLIFSTR